MIYSNAQFPLLLIISLIIVNFQVTSALSLQMRTQPLAFTNGIDLSSYRAIPLSSQAYIQINQNPIKTTNSINSQSAVIKPSFNTIISPKERMWSILAILLFTLIYLLAHIAYTWLKGLNSYISKGVINISNQIILLFICYSILFFSYSYGYLNAITLNWPLLLLSIALFILSWITLCFIILFLSQSIITKWETSESLAKSFIYLKQLHHDQPNQRREIIDAFELLILKRYFSVPLFPVLKPSSLRRALKLSQYLQYCLSDNLRLFFKVSWTSWIVLIVIIMCWYVFIMPLSIFTASIIVMIVPLIGIFTCLGIYAYARIKYREIIVQLDRNSIVEFIDYDYESNDMFQSLVYPVYLKKAIDYEGQFGKDCSNDESNRQGNGRIYSYTLYEHMHQRTPSLYENIFCLGNSTFPILFNMIQCCSVCFVCWVIILSTYYARLMIDAFSLLTGLSIIIGSIIMYLLIQTYVILLGLKWLTMMGSIEMKRNDNCLRKLISSQLKEAGKISKDTVNQFNMLFFEQIKSNEHDTIVNNFHKKNQSLKELIKANYQRFKGNTDLPLTMGSELKQFLLSCGSSISSNDISFISSLIKEDNESVLELGLKPNDTISLNELYTLCGTMLFFRSIKPHDMIRRVFDNYYNSNPQIYKETMSLKWKNIDLFLQHYSNHFTDEMASYIKEECQYIGQSFSLDQFISMLVTPMQFYPN